MSARHYRFLWCALSCLCCHGCVSASARTVPQWRTQIAHGFLAYQTHHPLYLQMVNVPPMRVAPLARRGFALHVVTSYSNIFEQFTTARHDVLLDMEMLRQTVGAAWGLGHGMTAELSLPLVHTGGGFLDAFLEGFHRAFGLPNAGRENFPQDRFVFRVATPAGTLVDAAPAGYRPADLQLRLRQEVLPESRTHPGIGWFAAVDLPTGSAAHGLGNGAVDVSVGALAEKSYRRWHGYGQLGYTVHGGQANLEDLLYPAVFSYVAGGEFSLSQRVGLHAQIHGGTPLLANMGEMRWDDPPLDLAVGFSGDYPGVVWGKDLFWQVGFSEDLHADGPSIDLTVFTQLGLRWNR